jgi:carboxypeptidase C (cathepsin A)
VIGVMPVRGLAVALALATGPLLAGGTPAAFAEEGAAPALRAPLSAVTEHRGRFGGESIRYRAEVAENFVPGADGKPAGAVVTISYLRRDADAATRPVTFLFNGGPGASTTPFHFDFFGPRRRLGEGDEQWMVENADSPLDATDLVFIDPVGTGYSRPLAGSDGAQFWSRTSDAASVAQVIKDWLRGHGREGSPRYLAGQSYGTVRAATMLANAADLEFDGVLLFALVGNAEGSEMPQVVSLPTMAAIAWYHGRIERGGRSVEQAFDEAVEFARGEYVTALIKGASLPPEERRAVAARMAALTGLPADFIEKRRLRVSKEDFYLNLLKDQGLRTGQLDGRATARLDAPPQRPPYDDPGISYTPDPPPPAPMKARTAGSEDSALERYFRQELRFQSPERYIALNLDVNQAWKPEGAWGEGTPFQSTEAIAAAMQARPKLRLFWVTGLYDLSTPAYSGRYALDRAGVPADRLTAVQLPGGHSVYKDEANRRALADAVRRFVTAAR